MADLVKASDEDLEALYPGTRARRGGARRCWRWGRAAVVVTRGAEGATWFGADGEVRGGPRRVEVADTIGAGDTFGAALIDALWERGRLGAERRDALHGLGPPRSSPRSWSTPPRAAAITVSRPGADPPYRSELG